MLHEVLCEDKRHPEDENSQENKASAKKMSEEGLESWLHKDLLTPNIQHISNVNEQKYKQMLFEGRCMSGWRGTSRNVKIIRHQRPDIKTSIRYHCTPIRVAAGLFKAGNSKCQEGNEHPGASAHCLLDYRTIWL